MSDTDRDAQEDGWQMIPLTGFDPDGEPNIRVMPDGTMYVVFEYMPPMWLPDEEWPEGSFA
jgi:hypothetical protein